MAAAVSWDQGFKEDPSSAFEDEYEMPNAKREAPGENTRKRSWKRTADPLARL
jgi:hypothetical protein